MKRKQQLIGAVLVGLSLVGIVSTVIKKQQDKQEAKAVLASEGDKFVKAFKGFDGLVLLPLMSNTDKEGQLKTIKVINSWMVSGCKGQSFSRQVQEAHIDCDKVMKVQPAVNSLDTSDIPTNN